MIYIYFILFFYHPATKNLFNKSEYDYEVLCFELFINCFLFLFARLSVEKITYM